MRAIEAEHDEHEQRRGGIEQRDQADQIAERRGAEFADGVGHGAEGADRRRLHDDGDHAEHRMRRVVDDVAQAGGRARPAPSAQSRTGWRTAAPAGCRRWAKAPTTLSGMMLRTKSTDFCASACLT